MSAEPVMEIAKRKARGESADQSSVASQGCLSGNQILATIPTLGLN
jgi:hypothetical protein